MKILMQNRVDAFKNMGGDTIQMLKTKEELEKIGYQVDISLNLNPDLEGYDIVHLFNITRVHETWLQFKNAQKQNKKIVLSPIHHKKDDINFYESQQLKGIAKILRLIFNTEDSFQSIKTFFYCLQSKKGFKGWIYQLIKGYNNQQLEVIKGVDMILPNSKMELEAILDDFNLSLHDLESSIVPNGVEVIENQDVRDSFEKKYKFKNFIFCPGRIEPRKNQLNIIEALKDEEVNIVFAGAINKKHKNYIKQFKERVRLMDNIHYVGELDREMMFSAYKSAKVGILASWFETTGLVGIEAIIYNCNVVMTNRGYTHEYYKEHAFYCDPSDVNSIKKAAIDAFNNPFQFELKNIAKKRYTWSKAAQITAQVYKKIM